MTVQFPKGVVLAILHKHGECLWRGRGAAAVTLLLRISIAFRAYQKKSLSMRTLTMNSVSSRRSTGTWRRQTDGAATEFKTEFETEVNLNIGLKPHFSVQIKHWFKT